MADMDKPEFYVQVPGLPEFGPATLEVLRAWAHDGRIPPHAMILTRDGMPGFVAWQHPQIGPILAPPLLVDGSVAHPAAGAQASGHATGGLIPYKNRAALIGYYVAVASLLTMFAPLVGMLVSGSAIVLGIVGLKVVRTEPGVRGMVHAWVAIVLGSLTLLASIGFLLVMPRLLDLGGPV
jgi:hypothetical protein